MGENNESKNHKVSENSDYESGEEIDHDTSCGFGKWRPQWLQVFASTKFFAVNFCIVSILQGAYFTYLIGTMSTLEKRFAFESKISGLILTADNLSAMFLGPVVGYLAARYNRSHLIAIGELVVSLSCFLSALPYFIYGPGLHLLSNTNIASNLTQYETCSAVQQEVECGSGHHSTAYLAVVLLWFASFANGAGYTAFFTIGLPYIDDNVKKDNSPLYLSILASVRLCGPSLGFLLGSACLAFYEDPFYDPHLSTKDPRWVGAWWIGFLVLGVLLLLFSLPMFMFPRQFKGASVVHTSPKNNTKRNMSKMKEIKLAVKRLARNPILLLITFGTSLRILGILGYYLMKPRYMETQYRQSASSASFVTGASSILTMSIGIMTGGLLIKRFKPKARLLVTLIFFAELVSCFTTFSAMFLNCPTPNFGNTQIVDGRMQLESRTGCNTDCHCTTKTYQPICSSDGVSTYFSPCHAGCQTIDRSTNPASFRDCSCISSFGGTAQSGYCPTDCDKFTYYVLLFSIGGLISSMSRTGNTIIVFRCVDPKDKSFAMGVMGSLLDIFAFIPYPLIFGAITDATCLVWEQSCGGTGNCWLYDLDKFRVYLHVAAFAFMITGTLFDIGVIAMADRMTNLYDDDDVEVDQAPQEVDGQNSIKLLSIVDRTNFDNDIELDPSPI